MLSFSEIAEGASALFALKRSATPDARSDRHTSPRVKSRLSSTQALVAASLLAAPIAMPQIACTAPEGQIPNEGIVCAQITNSDLGPGISFESETGKAIFAVNYGFGDTYVAAQEGDVGKFKSENANDLNSSWITITANANWLIEVPIADDAEDNNGFNKNLEPDDVWVKNNENDIAVEAGITALEPDIETDIGPIVATYETAFTAVQALQETNLDENESIQNGADIEDVFKPTKVDIETTIHVLTENYQIATPGVDIYSMDAYRAFQSTYPNANGNDLNDCVGACGTIVEFCATMSTPYEPVVEEDTGDTADSGL